MMTNEPTKNASESLDKGNEALEFIGHYSTLFWQRNLQGYHLAFFWVKSEHIPL